MPLRRYAYLDPQHPAVADLPPIVHDEFHTLYPLDEAAVSKTLGLSTCHFKAMSMKDASVVTLRRIYNTPCACTTPAPVPESYVAHERGVWGCAGGWRTSCFTTR